MIASHIVSFFEENNIIYYEIPMLMLTDTNEQSINSLFVKMRCPSFCMKHLPLTKSSFENNGQKNCYNEMIIDGLEQYMAEQQHDF